MNIKKVDDKPMVIHTKLHVKAAPETKLKGRNVLTVDRSPKIVGVVNFDNRPQFTEMIELAKQGKIDCIMVKDFSRFGRDYVELGNYLEQLFPFMGVRFISVNDNYDSAELADGTTGGLDVAFKNLIYDYYSREMSKKQKIAWKRMAEKGQYNATCALYGYRKSKEDKHKLVIEPEEAAVVREIFDMKIAGIGTTHIAKSLNRKTVGFF